MHLQACRAVTTLLAIVVLSHLGATLHRCSHAPYQCEMTYMHPTYERVDVDSKLAQHYGLFTYRDAEADAPQPGERWMHIRPRIQLKD